MSIKFENVFFTYQENTPFCTHALNNINLEINDNEFVGLIGHTGSGKSTLVQHINALLRPSKGVIKVGEYEIIAKAKKIKNLKNLKKYAGLVFQFPEYQLFEDTIEKDIIFGPKNFGIDEQQAKEAARKVIKAVGLDESYLQKSPFDLSGGQKRRVAIAGILVMDPDVLVLDEPTAGLDPQGAKEMMDLFKTLNNQRKTVVIVTHDMNHVLNYCDFAVVMNKGEIVKKGTVDEIFKDASYLENLSIDLPVITHFIYELNQQGFHIDPSIKEIEQLVQAIKEEL